MNKNLEMIIVLALALALMFVSFTIFILGKYVYGPDAALLFASGMLCLMATNGIGSFIRYLMDVHDSTQGGKDDE